MKKNLINYALTLTATTGFLMHHFGNSRSWSLTGGILIGFSLLLIFLATVGKKKHTEGINRIEKIIIDNRKK